MGRIKTLLGGALIAAVLHTPAMAQQVTLDVLYCFPAFAKFHEAIANDFMKRHPDIKIAFRAPAASYDEGHQTMLRQAVTNQLPDVYYSGFHLQAELVRTLVKRNQIVELGPLLANESAIWRDANYSQKILDLGKVDGKQYGMAVNASTPIMYYNVDLVKKAGGDPDKMPDTWEGVIELAKKIRAAQPNTAGMAYNVHDWPDDWLWRGMIHQDGGNMLDPTGTKIAFGGDVGLKALTLFRRFVVEGGMPMIDWDQSRQQFIAGQIGLFFDTPARLRQVTDLVGDKWKLRTAVFPVDNKAHGGLPTGGNAVVITAKEAAKQKAAWEFAKFMTGPEAQKIIVETTGYLPTNKLALGKDFLGPFYDANPNFRTVALQMDRSVPWQGYPGGNSVRIWRTQREVIIGVMRGDITPADGLAKIVKETTALMN